VLGVTATDFALTDDLVSLRPALSKPTNANIILSLLFHNDMSRPEIGE
jgi:hypothetical protein